MDWEYKLTICNDVGEEETTNITEDSNEYWGFDQEEDLPEGELTDAELRQMDNCTAEENG